jgi:hypothetical protein
VPVTQWRHPAIPGLRFFLENEMKLAERIRARYRAYRRDRLNAEAKRYALETERRFRRLYERCEALKSDNSMNLRMAAAMLELSAAARKAGIKFGSEKNKPLPNVTAAFGRHRLQLPCGRGK